MQSLIQNRDISISGRVGGDTQTNHEAPTAEGASCNPLRHHFGEVIGGPFAGLPYNFDSLCLNTDRPICMLDSKDLNAGQPGVLVLWHCCLYDQAPLVAVMVIVEQQTHCQGANVQIGERCAVVEQVAGDTGAAGTPPGQVLQDGLEVTPRRTSDNSAILLHCPGQSAGYVHRHAVG